MPDFPLPLPLTAFEEYMLRDDRPNYPMSVVARLRFTGQLDRRATAEALEMTLARHLLLRAKIQRTPAGSLAWIPLKDYRLPIEWIDGPEHDRLPAMRPIDLFSEPGLRVWVTTDAQRSSLFLQVHHAACDGKGVLQVADDFMRSYARISAGKQPPIELSPCNPQALQGRGSFGLTLGKYLRILPAQITGLLGVRRFLMRRPVPLLEPAAAISSELPAGFPDVKVGRLEADEVRKLSAIATAFQVTVNDWLIRDFFVAVDDFRSRHQTTASQEWIRFSIPMNLRQGADNHMPAANVVSMVFFDRTPKEIADSAGLLQSIHSQMDLIRRRQLGLIFVLSLSVMRFLPGGLAKRVNKGRCEATCVLSNLGRIMADSPLPRCNEKIVAGNIVLDGMDIFSPIRDGTTVSAALVFYAGELKVCMQYDSRRITEAQADDLMATYLRKIRTSIDMAS